MSLADFITRNTEAILVEWEAFALTRRPASAAMSSLELRDHAQQLLEAIAVDLDTAQSSSEQSNKSKGLNSTLSDSAGAVHGSLRHRSGFDLRQVVSEYRALRATVIRLWEAQPDAPVLSLNEITRFHESMDQSLAESVSRYSDEVENSRHTFLAILGHDLRSPLNSIAMASAYLARTGTLDDAQSQAVARTQRAVVHMTTLINDLIEFTKVALGSGVPIVLQNANLGQICKDALDEVQTAYPDRSFRLETSGDLNAAFDRERIHQVLSNLLNNAVQHGSSDSPVFLSASGDVTSITFQIRNYGKAIPPEALKRIFYPWVQLTNENSETRLPGSVGLGLYIAREIVQAHKGSIDVKSTDHEGTIFTAQLPRNRVERRLIPRET